jgi:hypothetical protein
MVRSEGREGREGREGGVGGVGGVGREGRERREDQTKDHRAQPSPAHVIGSLGNKPVT